MSHLLCFLKAFLLNLWPFYKYVDFDSGFFLSEGSRVLELGMRALECDGLRQIQAPSCSSRVEVRHAA